VLDESTIIVPRARRFERAQRFSSRAGRSASPSFPAAHSRDLVRYGSHVAAYPNVLVRYGSHVAAYPNVLVRYGPHVAAYPNVLVRYGAYLAAYPHALIRYGSHTAAYTCILSPPALHPTSLYSIFHGSVSAALNHSCIGGSSSAVAMYLRVSSENPVP
jgi:hypothetical protein